MAQAAWNLCPVSGVPSGTACYYSADQTFTDLSGTTTVVIDDCPDGTSLPSQPLLPGQVNHDLLYSCCCGAAAELHCSQGCTGSTVVGLKRSRKERKRTRMLQVIGTWL